MEFFLNHNMEEVKLILFRLMAFLKYSFSKETADEQRRGLRILIWWFATSNFIASKIRNRVFKPSIR